MKQRVKGFTLIELMITVVILGILAAIAYPSYQDQVRKGHRAAAQSFMMALASKQEQYLLDNRGYAATVSALNMTQPPETNGKYTFSIAAGTAPPSYTITATAVGAQAPDGNLTLSSTGAKTPPDKWKR